MISTYDMTFCESKVSRERKPISGYQLLGLRKGMTPKGQKRILGGNWTRLYFDCGSGDHTTIYIVKTAELYTKKDNTVWKFFLNRKFFI